MEHNAHVQNHPVTTHTVEHTPVVDKVIQKIGHAFDSPHAAGSTKTTLGLDNAEHSYPKATGGKRDPNAPHKLTKDFGAAQTGDYGGAVGNPKPEYNTMGIAAVQQELAAGGAGLGAGNNGLNDGRAAGVGSGLGHGQGAGAGVGAGAGAGAGAAAAAVAAAAGAGPAGNATLAHDNQGMVGSTVTDSHDKHAKHDKHDKHDKDGKHGLSGLLHKHGKHGDNDNTNNTTSGLGASTAAGGASGLPGGLTNAKVIGTYTEKTDPSLIAQFDHPHPAAESGHGLFNSHAGEPGGIKGDHHIPGL